MAHVRVRGFSVKTKLWMLDRFDDDGDDESKILFFLSPRDVPQPELAIISRLSRQPDVPQRR